MTLAHLSINIKEEFFSYPISDWLNSESERLLLNGSCQIVLLLSGYRKLSQRAPNQPIVKMREPIGDHLILYKASRFQNEISSLRSSEPTPPPNHEAGKLVTTSLWLQFIDVSIRSSKTVHPLRPCCRCGRRQVAIPCRHHPPVHGNQRGRQLQLRVK